MTPPDGPTPAAAPAAPDAADAPAAGATAAAPAPTAAPAAPAGADRSRTITWSDPHETASAAAGKTGLEFIEALARGAIPAPPIMATIGASVVAVERGSVTFAFEPAEYHYNPIGSVHGGVYATLLDSAAGCSVHTMLPAGVGYTSLDLSVKFLGAIRAGAGVITCRGSVTHLGRRTALAAAELRDGGDRLLATATSSCLIIG